MSHRVYLLAAFSLVLSGCASVHFYKLQPAKMYSGDRQLSDTAVFSADDEMSHICALGSSIQMVDGSKTSRWNPPIWVRVTPGTHNFDIRCNIKSWLGWHSAGVEYANVQVVVRNMEVRHVYVARYEVMGGKVEANASDMGEHSYYAIHLAGQFVRPEF